METCSIHGLTGAELDALARARLASGSGVSRLVYRQAMRQGRYAPEEFGVSQASAQAWRRCFDLRLPELRQVIPEQGPGEVTAKAVLRAADGACFECVRLPMGRDRNTLCVSTQVGCRMGCRFCQTGRMGLIRQLSAEEIVGQVLVARHVLGWPVRNVVLMGMGEPLDNWANVRQALRVLADQPGLSFTGERTNLCTVGHVEGIGLLGREGWRRLNLSISLNAGNDSLRNELMPATRRWPLAALQAALIAYRPRRNFLFIINHCLLPGINDTERDAAEIASFCRPLGRMVVNLIPYNPGDEPLTTVPTEAGIVSFIDRLRGLGIPVRRRMTKGRSVMAACGQLGASSRSGASGHQEVQEGHATIADP